MAVTKTSTLELLAHVKTHIADPANATLAAEALGDRISNEFFPAITALLSSQKAYVREGAWLALGRIATLCPSVLQLASYASHGEKSSGVSEAIDDVVRDVEDAVAHVGWAIPMP